MIKIVDTDYIKDYTIRFAFNEGSVKDVDLKPILYGEVFGELLDMDNFIQYGVTPHKIEWASGADLASEFLYENGVDVES